MIKVGDLVESLFAERYGQIGTVIGIEERLSTVTDSINIYTEVLWAGVTKPAWSAIETINKIDENEYTQLK
jgi:hypothetical protein